MNHLQADRIGGELGDEIGRPALRAVIVTARIVLLNNFGGSGKRFHREYKGAVLRPVAHQPS
jgi:hypothetical protein